MNREDIILLATYITDSILDQSIIPAQLFKKLSRVINGDSTEIYKLFLEIWNKKNQTGYLNLNQPLLFSRGFNTESTTEEQLASYLPEEKILINKDIFRNILKNVDLVNISTDKQANLIERLTKESIGLSTSDILLYYNLLKINQLSGLSNNEKDSDLKGRDYPSEIYKLAVSAFNLTPLNIRKINGTSKLEEKNIISLLTDAVNKKRINPQVLSICLGHNNRKFIDYFINFITFFIRQRGDDVQEILTYIGFYILFNGAPTSKLNPLNLSSSVEAFVSDRIGRVRSVYYVAMLFIHTYNVILAAQIYEISLKYENSPLEQKLKLEKLYNGENRRLLLIKNAENIATRKISSFKNESIEVLNAYKRFTSNKRNIVSVNDIFDNDWRK